MTLSTHHSVYGHSHKYIGISQSGCCGRTVKFWFIPHPPKNNHWMKHLDDSILDREEGTDKHRVCSSQLSTSLKAEITIFDYIRQLGYDMRFVQGENKIKHIYNDLK